MVGVPDLVDFLRDPAVVAIIAVSGAVVSVLAWLYSKLHKPKLEVSLEAVLTYPDPEYAIPEQSPRKIQVASTSAQGKTKADTPMQGQDAD